MRERIYEEGFCKNLMSKHCLILKVHETVHSSWFTVHSRKVNGEHAGEQERVPKTIKRAG